MNINLHIERLILDGLDFPSSQQHLLQAGVEMELSRLLGEGGLAAHLMAGGAQARIVSPAIPLQGGHSSAEFGQKIAAAVYAGLGK